MGYLIIVHAAAHAVGDASGKNDYYKYSELVPEYLKAAYALKGNGEIQVTLRVVDEYGIRNNSKAVTLKGKNGTYALSSGDEKTLRGLVNKAGYLAENQYFFQNTADGDCQWFVILNGKVLKYTYTGGSSWDWNPELRNAYSWESGSYTWGNIGLSNGDEVTLVRAEVPKMKVSYVDDVPPVVDWMGYLSTLNFTDNADKTIVEEETLNLTVQMSSGLLVDSKVKSGFAGVTLFAYGPVNEDGTYPQTPAYVSSGVTDGNGKASFQINKTGTYLIMPVDMRANEDVPFKSVAEDGEFYMYEVDGEINCPSLHFTDDMIIVTVTPAEDSEVEARKVEALSTLDASHANANEYNLGNKVAEEGTAYETAVAAVNAAESLTDISNALETYDAAYQDILDALDANFNIEKFREVLDYFPDAAELQENGYTAGVSDLVEYLSTMYEGATGAQKDMLTGADKAKYDAILAAECTGAAGTVSFQLAIEGVDPANFTSSNKIQFYPYFSVRKDSSLESQMNFFNPVDLGVVKSQGAGIGDDGTYRTIDPLYEGKVYPTKLQANVYGTYKDTLEFVGYRIDDGDVEGNFTCEQIYNYLQYTTEFAENWMTAGEHTVTFVVKEKTALDQAKAAAKNDLKTAYDTYTRSDYTSDNWTTLSDAYSAGVTAIDAAETEAEINTAKSNAISAMAAVEKKAAGSAETVTTGTFDAGKKVGTVTVIVENNTFPGGAFTGKIIEKQNYAIGENDSMMTVVLRALHDEGFSWNGTGGENYQITYLASIAKDGKKLGEFDGEPGSGWMGTLNDWFVNYGFSEFKVANGKLADGDIINVVYTQNTGEDVGGSWGNSDTSLKDLTVNTGTLSPNFDGSVTEYTLMISGDKANVVVTPTAANKNYLVKTFLNEKVTTNTEGNSFYKRSESITVKPGDVIYVGIGERAWPSMNNQGAEARNYSGTW